MVYSFLVETYASERLKTLNVWSMFRDEDLDVRPHPRLDRDRTAHEHMAHQCQSEARWFRTLFDIDLGSPPLPGPETRLAFIQRYADDSGRRLARLREKNEAWWAEDGAFFDTTHSRAWTMVRRGGPTPPHRGGQRTRVRPVGGGGAPGPRPAVDNGGGARPQAVDVHAHPGIRPAV